MPLFWLSLAFLCGIYLGQALAWPVVYWLVVVVLTMALWLLAAYLRRLHIVVPFLHFSFPSAPVPYPLLAIVLWLGAARLASAQPVIDSRFIAWYNDRPGEYWVSGVIAEPPDERDQYTNLRVQVESIHQSVSASPDAVNGLLLVRAPPGDWQYGDRLRLHGALFTPPQNEDFSYRDYLAVKGIYSYMPRATIELSGRQAGNPVLAALYGFKQRALAVVYHIYPDPEASLLAGILLGVDTGIPPELQTAFQITGTAHIVAISGFNITIIAGLFVVVFSRIFGRRRGAVAAALGIAVYTLLVGAEASVVRAAVMGGLSLLARQIGRRQQGLNSLAFVAALMSLFNPFYLWDVSFQLSFMATLGLVLYAGPMTQATADFFKRWLPAPAVNRIIGPLSEFFLLTIAAQITTLPIMALRFQRFSLIAFIVNPLVLPAQTAVEILGGLSILGGLLYLPLGRLIGLLAWPFVAFTIQTVELFAQAPGAAFSLAGFLDQRSLLALSLGYYFVLLAWVWLAPRLRQALTWMKPGLVATVIGVLAVLVWRQALQAPDGRLHLVVLDVSANSLSGDAILLQSPSGRYVLIDGGPSPTRLSDALGRRLPIFTRRLDGWVTAGLGAEQVGALPRLVERFSPNLVWMAGPWESTANGRSLHAAVSAVGIPLVAAQAGQVLDLGSGAQLRMLAVGKRGAALLVEWQSFRCLLPVGMDLEMVQALQKDPALRNLSALLLPESGKAPIELAAWMQALNPQVVLLSVSPADARRPDAQTLQAVTGYPLLRTDQNGWIDLQTDGQALWILAEK